MVLTNMPERNHKCRRKNVLRIFSRGTQANASGACALCPGHDFEPHKPVHGGVENEFGGPEEASSTPTAFEF